MSLSESEYRTERARQTDILQKAIEQTLKDVGDGFETPMLNAVIGALIAHLAEALAAVGDHRTRKQLRQLVEKELSRQIAGLVAEGRPSAQTMIIRGGLH